MSNSMKAAVLTEYKNIEWKTIPVPEISDEEVLIHVSYGGICGSDQHIFLGEFAPRTSTPLVQGHEFGGTVTKVGDKVTGFREGDRVVVDPIIPCGECGACKVKHYPACTTLKLVGVDLDGGFAEYVKVHEGMVYKISDKISDRHSALVELFSIGFHASNRSGIQAGQSALIWGGGRVGQCIMQAARTITDKSIFVVDVLDKRLEIAQSTCKDITIINPLKENPVDVVMEATGGMGVDVAFEAVGHGKHLENVPDPVLGCVKSIRGGGTICVLGLSDEPVPLVMKHIIWKEAKLIASRVSHGEFKEAIEYMDKGELNPEVLISAEFGGDQAQHAFEILDKEPQNYLKVLLKF